MRTSSTWSLRIALLVAAVIAGLLGMHVLDGHGTPMAGADPSAHVAMSGSPMPATTAAHEIVEAVEAVDAVDAVAGDGCTDCAEHAAMTEGCVLAPVPPAALPGPPAEDLRPAIVAPATSSAASVPAAPRPPSISALCISRR